MNPKQFLLLGGIILVVLGVAGLVVLGPTPEQSLLGNAFYLDNTENMAHLLFGVVALGAYFGLKDANLTKWLVVLVGIVALAVAVLGFVSSGNPAPNVGVSNLESPLDNILHIGVAVWAFAAAFMGKKATGSMSGPSSMPPTQV